MQRSLYMYRDTINNQAPGRSGGISLRTRVHIVMQIAHIHSGCFENPGYAEIIIGSCSSCRDSDGLHDIDALDFSAVVMMAVILTGQQ